MNAACRAGCSANVWSVDHDWAADLLTLRWYESPLWRNYDLSVISSMSALGNFKADLYGRHEAHS